jgi:hypothetical protein
MIYSPSNAQHLRQTKLVKTSGLRLTLKTDPQLMSLRVSRHYRRRFPLVQIASQATHSQGLKKLEQHRQHSESSFRHPATT